MYNRRFFCRIDKEGAACTVRRTRDANGETGFLVETGNDREHFSQLSEEEQSKALKWIGFNVIPAEKVLDGHTSYGMKHILESRTNIYMTNNQFKEAMLRCGFFPADAGELNWHFYIRKSSPIFKAQTDGRDGLPMLGEPVDYHRAGWEYRHGSWECSECGQAPNDDGCWPDADAKPGFSFCPHCGTKMKPF